MHTPPAAPQTQADLDALLTTLSSQERAVWHWYVIAGASWRQTVRELGLEDKSHLERLFHSISEKIGIRLEVVRKQRDQKIREHLRGTAA